MTDFTEDREKSPAPKLFYAADLGKRDRMRDDYDAFEAKYYLANL